MTPTEYGEVCDGCGKLLICRSCGKIRSPTAAQAEQVRLEARPADNSKEWTEIFPAQLEWVAKEGHQVRAIELAAQPPAAPVETAPEAGSIKAALRNIAENAVSPEFREALHSRSSAGSLDLKPCPFCGRGAYFYENQVDFVRKWSVSCGDCGANLDVCEDTEAEAAARWNTRTINEPQPAPLTKEVVLDWLSKNTLYFSARWPLSRPHGGGK